MRSKSDRDRAGRRVFPPSEIASVKAVACEMPAQLELPFSRFSIEQIRRVVIEKGVVEAISVTTLWEWLHEDGLRPWTHRPWIFPRDPDFLRKGSLVLDLYHRMWDGKPLDENDFGIRPTRRRAFKRADASIRARRLPPSGQVGSSTSTSARVRWRTWPRTTFIERAYSGDAMRRPASLRLTNSSST